MVAPVQGQDSATSLPAKGLALGWVVADSGDAVLLSPSDMDVLRQLGVQIVRFTLRLGQKASWDDQLIQLYAQVARSIVAAGIQPMAQLTAEVLKPASQNLWNANARELDPRASGDNPFIERFVLTAKQLVHALPSVPYWVVWNEPNAYTSESSPGHYTGSSFIYPSLFATLLRGTHAVLKAESGERRVVTGGLFGHNLHGMLDAASVGATYLQALYHQLAQDKVTSMPFDIIGQHYYLDQGGFLDPAHLEQALGLLTHVLDANEGVARRTVHVVEAGWQTQAVSESVQAANLDQLFAGCAGSQAVKAVNWFLLTDNPAAGLYFGLRRADGQAKEAFAHLQFAQDLITYIVQQGDSLSAIGERLGVPWQSIYETNRVVIGTDPNLIVAGQRLVIPKV